MDLNPANLKLAPFFHSMKQVIDGFLPNSSSTLHVFVNSTAVQVVTIATFKNLPFIAFGSHLEINNLCHWLSARVSYLEASLMTLASFIHNFAMSLLYTGLAALAFGFSDQLNFSCYQHWQHTAYSVLFFGVAFIGILIPTLAAGANIKLLEIGCNVLKENFEHDRQKFETPLIEKIKAIYEENKTNIKEFLESSFDTDRYAIEIAPLKNRFNQKINSVKNLSELWEILQEAYRGFRDGVELRRKQPSDQLFTPRIRLDETKSR